MKLCQKTFRYVCLKCFVKKNDNNDLHGKELSSVPSEFRRHRDDFTDYVHATLRKRELDKTVDAFLKDRQKRPGGGPHRG